MKNMRIKKDLTKFYNSVALWLIIIMANFFCIIHASENVIATADMLTKASYTSPQIADVLLLFSHDHAKSLEINYAQNIPSVEEIIEKITELENSQSFIKNNTIRQQAICSLHATIKAIDKALSVACMHQKNKDDKHILPEPLHENLVSLLSKQKQILEKKIIQLNEISIRSCYSNFIMKYIIVTVIISILITGVGASYYFGLFNNNEGARSNEPIIFSGPFNEKRDALYTKMSEILNAFVDPNDKQSTTTYLNEAKSIIQELDPINDAAVIEMLNTFIESQRRLEIGMFNKDFFDNARFWKETHDKKHYYTKILTEILNHNPKRDKVFISDDLDIRELLSQKNKYNQAA